MKKKDLEIECESLRHEIRHYEDLARHQRIEINELKDQVADLKSLTNKLLIAIGYSDDVCLHGCAVEILRNYAFVYTKDE